MTNVNDYNFFNKFSDKEKLQLLKLASQNKNVKTLNINHGLKLHNTHILSNMGKGSNIGVIEQNSMEVLPGGYNPSIPLAARIMGGEHVYKSDFFGTKGRNREQITVKDFLNVDNVAEQVSEGEGAFKGFLDDAVFKLYEEQEMYKNVNESRAAFGGRTGNQIAPANNVHYSENPRYVMVHNYPYFITAQYNITENLQYESIYGINLNKKAKQLLLKEAEKTGMLNTDISLVGDPAIGMEGLFNNEAMQTLSARDVGSLFGSAKSINDIFRSGNSYINAFAQKISQLVNGSVPDGFDMSQDYNQVFGASNRGLPDAILVMPTTDYIALLTVDTTNFGGQVQFQVEKDKCLLNCANTQLTLLPARFFDHKKSINGQDRGYNLCNTQSGSESNTYCLYSKSSFHTLFTVDPIAHYTESKSDYGRQENISMMGARTGVFCFEKIGGFLMNVAQ